MNTIDVVSQVDQSNQNSNNTFTIYTVDPNFGPNLIVTLSVTCNQNSPEGAAVTVLLYYNNKAGSQVKQYSSITVGQSTEVIESMHPISGLVQANVIVSGGAYYDIHATGSVVGIPTNNF